MLGGCDCHGDDIPYSVEILPGTFVKELFFFRPADHSFQFVLVVFLPDGRRFVMSHNGWGACGIPDKDTIVMTGGFNPWHSFVTRCIWEFGDAVLFHLSTINSC